MCWEFCFQLFDFWPQNYYWLLIYLQAAADASGSPCRWMRDMCGPRPTSEIGKIMIISIIVNISSDLCISPVICVYVLFWQSVERFPAFVNLHLSPEWHLCPSYEKALVILFSVQTMKYYVFIALLDQTAWMWNVLCNTTVTCRTIFTICYLFVQQFKAKVYSCKGTDMGN